MILIVIVIKVLLLIIFFDSSNNLIQVWYYNWNKDNINKDINYHYDKQEGGESGGIDSSGAITLLNWKKYASNWDDFTILYPNFVFENNSYLRLSSDEMGTSQEINLSNINTNKILPFENTPYNYNLLFNMDFYPAPFMGDVYLYFYIWYDSQNIVCSWYYKAGTEFINLNIHLNNILLKNIMNDIS